MAAHAGARWCLTRRCHGPPRMRRRLRRVSWSFLLCAALLLCQLPVLLWWEVRCAVLSMLCGRVMMALGGFSKVLLSQSVREIPKFPSHHPFKHATLKGEVLHLHSGTDRSVRSNVHALACARMHAWLGHVGGLSQTWRWTLQGPRCSRFLLRAWLKPLTALPSRSPRLDGLSLHHRSTVSPFASVSRGEPPATSCAMCHGGLLRQALHLPAREWRSSSQQPVPCQKR